MRIGADTGAPEERRLARAWFQDAAEVSYPDLALLGRVTRRERLDALFEAHWLHPERRLWFAVEPSQGPVGLAWVQASNHAVSDLPDWLVVCLAVAPACRGQGIGRALMGHVRAQAACHGVARLRLYVAAANAPARHLYEALGYTAGVVEMTCRLDPA
ncbi:MAG: GNAT family N-acetyltransferase [Candidatus Sericytochromatia bacterium]|nr:GNAT family N-acetyltransferase [Candidatus Sericytochromatia bacterium]